MPFVPDDGQPATHGVNNVRENTHGRLLKLVKVREENKWEKSSS